MAHIRESCDRMRGRLFELVEAIGLPERQEEALKRVIRRTSYDLQSDLESIARREE